MREENEACKTVPAKTFQQGDIAVCIWERSGEHGTYYEYTINRAFDGKSRCGSTFRWLEAANIRGAVYDAYLWLENEILSEAVKERENRSQQGEEMKEENERRKTVPAKMFRQGAIGASI